MSSMEGSKVKFLSSTKVQPPAILGLLVSLEIRSHPPASPNTEQVYKYPWSIPTSAFWRRCIGLKNGRVFVKVFDVLTEEMGPIFDDRNVQRNGDKVLKVWRFYFRPPHEASGNWEYWWFGARWFPENEMVWDSLGYPWNPKPPINHYILAFLFLTQKNY